MKWGKKQLTTVSYILTTVKVVTKATKALQIILALNSKVLQTLDITHPRHVVKALSGKPNLLTWERKYSGIQTI